MDEKLLKQLDDLSRRYSEQFKTANQLLDYAVADTAKWIVPYLTGRVVPNRDDLLRLAGQLVAILGAER